MSNHECQMSNDKSQMTIVKCKMTKDKSKKSNVIYQMSNVKNVNIKLSKCQNFPKGQKCKKNSQIFTMSQNTKK